jgi:hypothetical protein
MTYDIDIDRDCQVTPSFHMHYALCTIWYLALLVYLLVELEKS